MRDKDTKLMEEAYERISEEIGKFYTIKLGDQVLRGQGTSEEVFKKVTDENLEGAIVQFSDQPIKYFYKEGKSYGVYPHQEPYLLTKQPNEPKPTPMGYGPNDFGGHTFPASYYNK